MGILNMTPDSFYAQSRAQGMESGISYVEQMITDGVDIIDIGGESTRPGSLGVDCAEEKRRVLPLIKHIRDSHSIPISIDTQKALVAADAIEHGATMINDVSAGTSDPEMFSVAAQNGVQIVLMHMQGRPETMQLQPSYGDVVQEICEYLCRRIDAALAAGIAETAIIIDPGIGFGKRFEDNIAILQFFDAFVELSFPVLIGLSRKSFLGSLLKHADDPRDRLYGSIACHVWCIQRGVSYLRVHDVRACRDCIAVLTALTDHGS